VNRKPVRAEDLLLEMRSAVSPVDAPQAVRARRERTVAHLRGLQARSAVLRQVHSAWRKRLLVAAAFLIPSLALGAGVVRWSELTRGSANVAAAEPKDAPNPPRPAGRLPHRSPPVEDVGAAPLATSAPAVAADDGVPKPHGPARANAPATRRAAPAAEPSFAVMPEESSSLAEENRLMLTAMSAGRAGDDARAVRILTELLTRYPRSPLAQNATVERFRALKRSGDQPAASQAASRYMRDYPVGMASDEARGLAATPNPKARGDAFPR
jgi:hypothetical protein